MNTPINHLTAGFIGLGLIGGSIARGLKRSAPDIQIMAYMRTREKLEQAHADGIVDLILDGVDEHLSECDIIFLCTPVEFNESYLRQIRPFLKEGAIVTDVGSTKTSIHETVAALGMESCFVGGHPMAGSEKTGYESSTDHLLENAYYIITPTPHTPASHTDRMVDVAKAIGALPLVLDYHRHDFIVAAISHLPHLIASSLVNLVHDCDSEDQMMKRLAAGGFKDITRIASSSPVMWEQICMSALQHQETKWTLPLAALTWWMPSVRPSKTKMWYHRTAWILPTVPRKSLKHCSLETERYMKSIRTSRETAWRQSYGYL